MQPLLTVRHRLKTLKRFFSANISSSRTKSLTNWKIIFGGTFCCTTLYFIFKSYEGTTVLPEKIKETCYVGEKDELDMPHGHGTMMYGNGDRYVGSFSHSQMHGSGVYTFVNCTVYEGQFINNKFEGTAKVIYPNKNILEGNNFITNSNSLSNQIDSVPFVLNGYGKSISFGGEIIYEGEFKNSRYYGKGMLTEIGIKTIIGFFIDGVAMDTNGIIKYHNGDIYYGEIANNKKNGKGKLCPSWYRYPFFLNMPLEGYWLDDVYMDKSPLFIPVDTFQGSKKGYYFSLGPRGLGYYYDLKSMNS